jgi:two-component system cell cycle response regulator DivK
MPELEGHAVLEQLRIDAACAQIPIVAVTAFSMADEGQKARLAGFDGYFSKPIEARTFVAELEAFLR